MSYMPDVDALSRDELKEQLEKHIRTFDIAYRTLLILASPGFNDLELIHKHAAQAVATIDRYPNDPAFRCEADAV